MTRPKQSLVALIIPAHNEAKVIATTINSAIAAGMDKNDVYVINDGSKDNTTQIVARIIPRANILTLTQGGKAAAIEKGFDCFGIKHRYKWVHISDADSYFDKNYFTELKKGMVSRKKYTALTGYVASMPGDWVCKYRVYEYTFALEVIRRIQHFFGVIPVIPGPSSCFRTSIFTKLKLNTISVTEDFAITIQMHRKKLGKIGYYPKAIVYTQDPKNYKDYVKQVSRWHRGFFQAVLEYKIGLGGQKIDIYLGLLMLEMFFYYTRLLIIYPIIAINRSIGYSLALTFLLDFGLFFVASVLAAMRRNRYDILSAFPLFYILRFTGMYLYLRAFVEVIILRRHQANKHGWETASRRYAVTMETNS